MKFFVIPPVAHLELMKKSTAGIYVLAHLWVKYPHYKEFILKCKEEGYYILLDNSAAEKELVNEDILIEIVRELKPHVVIPPDTLFDAKTTIRDFHSFAKRMKKEALCIHTKLFCCAQGSSIEEWVECYKEMMKSPLTVKLGLSKIAVPYCFKGAKNDELIKEARWMCVDYLKANNLLQKPIHCLGAGDMREFASYKDEPLVETTDSCNSVWSAMNDISFEKGNFTRIPTPKDYFEQELTKDQYQIALSNIEWLSKNV
jgi:hypothetical protein